MEMQMRQSWNADRDIAIPPDGDSLLSPRAEQRPEEILSSPSLFLCLVDEKRAPFFIRE